MKNYLIGILLFFSIYGVAQDSTNVHKFKHEVGIDATYILKSALILNSSNLDPAIPSLNNNYVLTYNYNFKKMSLRFGLGIDILGSVKNGDSHSTNDTTYLYGNDDLINNHKYFYFRMGIQKTKLITKNWQWYYGLDIVSSYKYAYSKTDYTSQYNYTTNNKSETTSITVGLGIGPIAGLKFKINEKISLSTETSLYYIMSTVASDNVTTTTYTNSLPRTINSHSMTNNFGLKLTVPIFVVLSFYL